MGIAIRQKGEKMDPIDRQAAIDAILHNKELYSNNFGDDPIDKYTIAIIDNDAQTIAQLPSAQPIESLTDKEQRIFLAAMGREEKVCKQVDEECRDCREPYEDSLVSVCREITRKVKDALWTKQSE